VAGSHGHQTLTEVAKCQEFRRPDMVLEDFLAPLHLFPMERNKDLGIRKKETFSCFAYAFHLWGVERSRVHVQLQRDPQSQHPVRS